MNKTIDNLEELKIEDLEEQDYLLIWDYSENVTKKISFATLMEFMEMMDGKYEN